jgi:serine protease Do
MIIRLNLRSSPGNSLGRLLVLVALAVTVAPAPAAEADDIAAVERRLHAVYKKVSPAIVKIEYLTIWELGSGIRWAGNHKTGIILTEQGHVVARGNGDMPPPNEVRKGPIAITLPGGRRVAATALGWSDTWNVELFKITDKGPWPHVEIDASVKVRPGDRCAVLSYPEWDFEFEHQPSLRTGLINQSAFPFWANCTFGPYEGLGGVFDLEGRFLGVGTRSMLSGFPTFTGVHVLKARWDDLILFGNSDRVRLKSVKRTATGGAASEAPPSGKEKMAAIGLAKSTTVHIEYPENEKWRNSSGVIITAQGQVISHSHGGVRSPGDMLTMSLSDGRHVKGQVLGFNPIADLTLIKIADSGPWPYAELGRSLTLESGEKCIFAGYPQNHRGQEPLIREMKVVTPKDHAWNSFLTAQSLTMPGSVLKGGDSGGGLFDSDGRLIGIASHQAVNSGDYFSRVELIRDEWDRLSDVSLIKDDKRLFHVARSSDPAEIVSTFDRVSAGAASTVVEILVEGKPQLLGTIVGSDGVILTKASELSGKTSCRLADGRVFPATIEKTSRECDVAILRIGAGNLPSIRWSESAPLVGSLCAAAGPGRLISAGIVAMAERRMPPRAGGLGVILEDRDGGVIVTDAEVAESRGISLKNGDIVRKIDGQPTPNLKALHQLVAPKDGTPIAIPGDFISVEVQRDNKKLDLRFRLHTHISTFSQFSRSPRRTGFPSIFDISQGLERTQCGGPVIDKAGAVIGIVIAAKGHLGTCVLPAKLLRALLKQEDLLTAAQRMLSLLV